jgi:hypothetical protein
MPEPHLRAADADRAAVAEVLGTHMSAGRLTVDEYDERLSRTYAARTYGELAELTADLPAVAGCGGPGAVHGWAGNWGHWGSTAGGVRAAWASWLTTAVIVVGIWALTSLGSGDWIYPWPVWVIGPWGVVLLAQTLGGSRHPGRDRDRRPERRAG